MGRLLAAILLCPSLGFVTIGADPVPATTQAFLDQYCLDCHDSETEKGGIRLDPAVIDWNAPSTKFQWERVLDALKDGQMPPDNKPQPSPSERQQILSWIDASLIQHTPIGGTQARRLNQTEYLATLKHLFGLKDFNLPPGFPTDRPHHGFDNLGEGLVLSPPLLEAYADTARQVADRIFPPPRDPPPPSTYTIAPEDFAISYSACKVVDHALRLGMKCDPIQRSCTWPSRMEAPASGTYRFNLTLSSFRAPNEPMTVQILARDVASMDSVSHRDLRVIQEIEVTQASPQTFEFEAVLYEGQTPVIHWANAILDSDRADKAQLQAFFRARDQETPRYLAAWDAMLSSGTGQGFRGGIGWERVKTQLARADLPSISQQEETALLKKIGSNPVLYAETVVFDIFENGPALEVHAMTIDGPRSAIQSPREAETARRQMPFLESDESIQTRVDRFLANAFRRPVEPETLASYVALYQRHENAGHSPQTAWHLLVRKALTSPLFLYRSLHPGPLDSYDLATRLAYFLTSAPPDTKLTATARTGRLQDPKVLTAQAERLLPSKAQAPFNRNFTSQWLDTRRLSEIMPDPRFKFTSRDEQSARSEIEYFFHEMLKENRPMTDFIDPDFTWTSARIAKNIYGLKAGFDKGKANQVHRVTLPRGGRYGGLLGNAAVMMATANGVDTQPVLRGVWVLENILGDPPPPPPNAVPPITPDTQGAKTPRELLAAHTQDAACASCHRKIDPVGLLLENFDPVGRWRDEWPDGSHPIDTAVTLHDGTPIQNMVEYKTWLVSHIEQVSQCVAEKLMTYATGRMLNYTERKEIAAVVQKNQEAQGGFRDLLLALLQTETFRTK